MTEIRYSLVTDGPTDQWLLPILTWLLHEHAPDCAVQSEWADLRYLRRPLTRLIDKIEKTWNCILVTFFLCIGMQRESHHRIE
jgi:hypothetical protein